MTVRGSRSFPRTSPRSVSENPAQNEAGAGDQPFVATVEFAFEQKTERSLAHVWENPLGFTVSAYRVDAETLETNP